MIYLGVDQGIYRWFEGAPWPVFHGLQGRSVVDLAAGLGGEMGALEESGLIWETADHGLNWRPAPLPEEAARAWSIAWGGEPTTLWTVTLDRAVYRKRVGQPSWVPMGRLEPTDAGPIAPTPRFIQPIDDLAFLSLDGGGLWRSEDGGRTWSRREQAPEEIFRIRKAGDRLVIATAEGVHASDDQGQSWRPLAALPHEARHVRAVDPSPDQPDFLLAGAAPVPVHEASSTGAGSEVPAAVGAAAGSEGGSNPAGGVDGRAATASASLYDSGLGFRLFESKDGGQTWTHVTRGFPVELEYDPIADIRFDPQAPEYAIVALASGECWRTRNGGEWWEPIARGIGSVSVLGAIGSTPP